MGGIVMSNEILSGSLFDDLLSDLSKTEIKCIKLKAKLAKWIQVKRKEMGLNQKQFSDFMGVKQAMISKWESGDYNFTIASLCDIFCKLDIDFDIVSNNRMERYMELNTKRAQKNTLIMEYDTVWRKMNIKPSKISISEIKRAV